MSEQAAGLIRIKVDPPSQALVPANTNALIDDWHKALDLRVRAQELAAFTASTYKIGMRKFIEWMASAQVSNPDADTVVSWKAEMLESGYRPGAVNVWLAGIKSFYRWAVSRRRLAVDITVDVEAAKRNGANQAHVRETLSDREMVRLLDHAKTLPARDAAMILLFSYTAVREIELHRADVADVKSRRSELTLTVHGKGRQEKDEFVIVAHEDAINALMDWLAQRGHEEGPLFTSFARNRRGERLSLSAIRTIVKAAFHAVGITDPAKTTHSIRHSAITNAIEHGADVISAQSMARHRNVQTTMIYFHQRRRLEEAAEKKIDYRDS